LSLIVDPGNLNSLHRSSRLSTAGKASKGVSEEKHERREEDTLELSTDADQLNKKLKTLKDTIDNKSVEKYKSLIESGKYQADSKDIASAMLKGEHDDILGFFIT
jgi:flagellar biosynthesis anti-sigma factor FlgM